MRQSPHSATKSVTAAIEALYNQDCSIAVISERVDRPSSVVTAMLARIRRRQHNLQHRLGSRGFKVFRRAALKRGISTNELHERLINTLVDDPALIDNVLDDGDEAGGAT